MTPFVNRHLGPTHDEIAHMCEVLGVDEVGLEENFFALGGHSLLVVELLFRVEKELGVRPSLEAFSRTPTAATLAAFGLSLFWLDLAAGPAVTVAFLTLALAQLWNVFNLREPESGVVLNEVTRNPWVWAALALCLGLIGLALWHPGLSALLHVEYPGTEGIALAAAASLVFLLFAQIARAFIPSTS